MQEDKSLKRSSRLSNLHSYKILDSSIEIEFELISKMAAHACNCPIALITFVDESRVWFKSQFGLDVKEVPLEGAFCGFSINDPNDILIVPDATKDSRFKKSPLVQDSPNVVFYAGVPIISEEDYALGTVCVMDHSAKCLDDNQLVILQSLSTQVSSFLKLKKKKFRLNAENELLKRQNDELKHYSYRVAHDLRSPLRNIVGLTDILISIDPIHSMDQQNKIVEHISGSASKLNALVESLLEHSLHLRIPAEKHESVDIEEFMKEIVGICNDNPDVHIYWKSDLRLIHTNATTLLSIMSNLISNAIIHNDKKNIKIEVILSETKESYKFEVIDNGPGIELKHQEAIFEFLTKIPSNGNYNESHGIGLSTVKKLVETSGGQVGVLSKIESGSNFYFTLPKKHIDD